MLAFDSCTQSVHGEVLEMLGIVVFAGGKSVEASGQPIDWRIKVDIIVIRENDVEVAIQLGCCKFMESLTHQRNAYEVALGALSRRYTQIVSEQTQSSVAVKASS